MNQFFSALQKLRPETHFLKAWLRLLPLIIAVSLVTGLSVALFLWLLDQATAFRWTHLWLIGLLPLAGIFIFFLYSLYGKNAAAGNNLVIDEIHEPGGGIPARMAPLVLFSTVVTHLFGGSAGREGTAVQMGGSVSYRFARWAGLHDRYRSLLLKAGMAAGFGAVFGTPLAGAVFALEVLVIGKTRYEDLVPCVAAAWLADFVCASCGIHHTQYSVMFLPEKHFWPDYFSFDLVIVLKVVAASVAFGFTARLFSVLLHGLKKITAINTRFPWLNPVVGAILVIGISYLLGTWDYLGLGVTNPSGGVSIVSCFQPGGAADFSWLWKLLLTVITIGTGFKGGEVTPLFFIGAALGHFFASVGSVPVDLFAALGFIAVFAGATNTPLACTLMGGELFGWHHVIYFFVACYVAYLCSGHQGIYSAQKVERPKPLFHRLKKWPWQ